MLVLTTSQLRFRGSRCTLLDTCFLGAAAHLWTAADRGHVLIALLLNLLQLLLLLLLLILYFLFLQFFLLALFFAFFVVLLLLLLVDLSICAGDDFRLLAS